MITADKNPQVTKALCLYQAYQMRRTFATVQVRYESDVLGSHTLPTIYYANHSSKWDQHVGGYITEELWKQDSYYMIALQMMQPYPILRKVGGFSVHQFDPFQAAQSMEYCSELLKTGPNRVVWVFPQGGINPNSKRPLNFQQGTAQLIRLMGNVRIVPVAIRHEFLNCSKPEMFLSFGTPQIFERPVKIMTRKLTEQLEATLTAELDRLTADVVNLQHESFQVILYSKGIFSNRLYTRYEQYSSRFRDKFGLTNEEESV